MVDQLALHHYLVPKTLQLQQTGDINISKNSSLYANFEDTGNNSLTAAKANNITDSHLLASGDNVLSAAAANIECSDLTADNNNIKANKGAIVVKNSNVTATNNNTLTASSNFTSTNSIFSAKANAVTANNWRGQHLQILN